MNLFSQNQPQQNLFQPNQNYQMPLGNSSGSNTQFRPNSAGAGGGSFGSTPLTGTNSLFNQPGGNNLFGNNSGNSNSMGAGGTSGNLWGGGGQQNNNNTNNNLFNRGNTMPASLFPGTGGQNNTPGNMFQTTQGGSNNTLFRSNTMMGGSSNQNYMGSNNSMSNNTSNSGYSNNLFNTTNRYQTRSTTSNYDQGTLNVKYVPKRNNDNLLVCCITFDKECKKSLEELRLEDYALMKAGKVPDNIQMIIKKNMQNLESGGGGGMMIGSSSGNNMFSGQNSGSMGGGNSYGMNSSNNLFGSNNNTNNQQRTGGWPNINSGSNNNMFQNNNNSMGSSNNLFGNNNQGMGNQSGGMGGNLFAPQGGNNPNQNFFNGNQNQNQNFMGNNSMMNNNSNSMGGGNNNLFGPNSQNRFQNQPNNMFSNNNNNQMGNNFNNNNQMNMGNPFQNRQGPNFLPTNNQSGNNNLFPNRMGGNQGFQQNQQGFFPQQNQMQQGGFFPNQQGMNPQFSLQGPNPHLFPQSQMGMPGQQSMYGHFYQNPQNFMYPHDGSMNPHLFPHPYQYPGYMGHPMQNPMNPYGVPILNPNAPVNMDKLQTSLFTPYGDDKTQAYTPRSTLNDVAEKLDSKLSRELISPAKNRSYLPYNPFERGGRRFELGGDRETVRNSALQWQAMNHSMMKKQEDTFTLIKKSKYIEDDVEIIMRPKPNFVTHRNRSYSPNNRNRSYSPVSGRSRESEILSQKAGPKNIYNSTIRVNIGLRVGTDILKNIEVKIFQKAKIYDLKMKALEVLRAGGVLRSEIADSISSMDEITSQATLTFNNRPLGNDLDLEDVKLGDNSTCELEIPENQISPSLLEESRRIRQPFGDISNNVNVSPFGGDGKTNPVSRRAPKLVGSEYKTQPSIEQLSRMTDRELAAVDGFTIWNAKGKVEFEGKTDLRDVDIDEAVVISFQNVEVYPDDKFKGDAKPVPGEKLNRPALITLYECYSKRRKTQKEYEDKARENGKEFVDYDEKNGVYRIRVNHF